jgi:hypothetical protein
MHQNGFYVVIHSMTYGYSIGANLFGYAPKKSIAQFPASFLNRAISFDPVSSHILSVNGDGNAQ